MYKTIIVHVDDSPLLAPRLRAAAALASAHGAHVVGAAATGMSWRAYAMLLGSMAVSPQDEYEVLRAQARRALARFAEDARRFGLESVEERLVEDEDRDALLLQSRYADLVIVGQDGATTASLRGLPQYLVMRGPRPVLVVPGSHAGRPIDDSIVVGWDGGVAALRAIDAAMPLLERARRVCLVLVNPGNEPALDEDEPGADMALYLARHGAPVEVLVERTEGTPGEALLRIAQAQDAGLLVAGAFGHGRYREIVLGGVTRILLERAQLPVLLAH